MQSREQHHSIWEAAAVGSLAEVRRLVVAGISVNARGSGKETPLHAAAANGHLPVLVWLLEHGADPNAKTKAVPRERHGSSPLHEALLHGHFHLAPILLDHGADVNARMSDGATPLILAVDAGKLETVKLLVRRGASVNVHEQMGFCPLHVALLREHMDVADFLTGNGALLDQRIGPLKGTILMIASEQKLLLAVDFLLHKGADPNLRDERGQNALHHAILGAGVEVTRTEWDETGRRVIQEDAHDAILIIDRLLSAGTDRAAQDMDGMSPVDWAKKLRMRQLVERLETTS